MYDYIKGRIEKIESSFITLECNGIGYLIYTPNPYAFKSKEEYTIYLYQYVREDELSLYGFAKEEERSLFLRLIDVKGLGCKMALPMLALGSPDGIIVAIEEENISYLKKFPKIGDKVARQIILDLKGKLVSSDTQPQKNFEELKEALKALGYKTSEIEKVLPKITEQETKEQIKEALKLMIG
jgi:Holliday junction DNA helicase RuvA